MPRKCTVCVHPESEAIDLAIVSGEPLRDIARQYGPSKDALGRHKDHIAAKLEKRVEQREAEARELRVLFDGLWSEGEDSLEASKKKGDLKARNGAIRELRGLLALAAKESRLERQNEIVELHQHPDFHEHVKTVVGALAPFPEARDALVIALSNRVQQ